MRRQAEEVSRDLRDDWPSALMEDLHPTHIAHLHTQQAQQAQQAGGGGAPSASCSGQYDPSLDDADMADALARYPRASEDVKFRIRQVFGALQAKFLEKYETWRVEAELAGAGATSSTGEGGRGHLRYGVRQAMQVD